MSQLQGGTGLGFKPNQYLYPTELNGAAYDVANSYVALPPGEAIIIPPGQQWVQQGAYSFMQYFDPINGIWRGFNTARGADSGWVWSDGVNYRVANLTGCPVAAVVTAGGSGYVQSSTTCTASAGGSTWQPIVGGAIATTLATATGTTTAGSGYTYPPIVIIDAPPQGGLQATAIVTALSAGTIPVANVQVINQGAGYTSAPNVTLINDPRDTTGSGAVVVTTLTATGTLTGLYPLDHGSPLTGVPTLAFSTGTAAATAIMNFTVTSYATGTIGSSIGAAEVTSGTNLIAAQASPAPVNPLHVTGTTFPRPARITAGLSGGTVVTTGQVVEDGGLGIQVVPVALMAYAITSTTAIVPAVGVLAVGGVSDTSFIQPV